MEYKPQNIEFTKPEIHKKGWGKEVWICNSPDYCGKILVFEKGKKCSAHMHGKREHLYLIKGKIELIHFNLFTGEELKVILEQGSIIHIPPFAPHQFIALEDSEFIEFSTQHFEDGSFRIGKGDSQA